MGAVFLEAPCSKSPRGIHACPVMTRRSQISKGSNYIRMHTLGAPFLYTPFGLNGMDGTGQRAERETRAHHTYMIAYDPPGP